MDTQSMIANEPLPDEIRETLRAVYVSYMGGDTAEFIAAKAALESAIRRYVGEQMYRGTRVLSEDRCIYCRERISYRDAAGAVGNTPETFMHPGCRTLHAELESLRREIERHKTYADINSSSIAQCKSDLAQARKERDELRALAKDLVANNDRSLHVRIARYAELKDRAKELTNGR
jgi:hypothetical protein